MKTLITSTLAVAAIASVAVASAPSKDIVDIAAGDSNFSTLVSLVKQAGLVDTLKSKGPFTVFAPTNAAFAKLPKATVDAVVSDTGIGIAAEDHGRVFEGFYRTQAAKQSGEPGTGIGLRSERFWNRH